eukprot:SAG11_NODE_28270_length_323_cov_1.383929_2_plen_77_part_01
MTCGGGDGDGRVVGLELAGIDILNSQFHHAAYYHALAGLELRQLAPLMALTVLDLRGTGVGGDVAQLAPLTALTHLS